MSDLPVLYLDVDGVLNALGYPPTEGTYAWPEPWQNKACKGGDRLFNIHHNVAMAKALRALPVEIRWLTTWKHDANNSIRHLFDWEEFPVITAETLHDDHWQQWKVTGLVRDVEEHGRPFVWVDDDMCNDGQALSSAAAVAYRKGVHHITIAPDPRTGLLPQDVEKISRWLLDLTL